MCVNGQTETGTNEKGRCVERKRMQRTEDNGSVKVDKERRTETEQESTRGRMIRRRGRGGGQRVTPRKGVCNGAKERREGTSCRESKRVKRERVRGEMKES